MTSLKQGRNVSLQTSPTEGNQAPHSPQGPAGSPATWMSPISAHFFVPTILGHTGAAGEPQRKPALALTGGRHGARAPTWLPPLPPTPLRGKKQTEEQNEPLRRADEALGCLKAPAAPSPPQGDFGRRQLLLLGQGEAQQSFWCPASLRQRQI